MSYTNNIIKTAANAAGVPGENDAAVVLAAITVNTTMPSLELMAFRRLALENGISRATVGLVLAKYSDWVRRLESSLLNANVKGVEALLGLEIDDETGEYDLSLLPPELHGDHSKLEDAFNSAATNFLEAEAKRYASDGCSYDEAAIANPTVEIVAAALSAQWYVAPIN